MRTHGPWTIEGREPKYRGDFVELVEDRVTRPDGSPGTYATVALKPGVAVLRLARTSKVLDAAVPLCPRPRHARGRHWHARTGREIPVTAPGASSAKSSDSSRLSGPNWAASTSTRPSCAARSASSPRPPFTTPTDLDATEDIRPAPTTFDAAVRMVMDGTITHAPSCVLILKAARRHRIEDIRIRQSSDAARNAWLPANRNRSRCARAQRCDSPSTLA